MEHKLLIDAALVNAIGEYLVGRPYREVANLVSALTQLVPAPSSEPSTAPAETE